METRDREITPDLFESLDESARDNERITGPSIGFWRDSWQRLKKNRAALVSLVLIVTLFAFAFVVGPLLTPFSPSDQNLARRYSGPSGEYWFGTDDFGRDMFARVWQGMRVSLYIAFIAAGLDLFVGVTFGAVSGLLGGKVDGVMQRFIEILNGIPILVVAILAMVVLDPGILTISIAIGAAGWTPMARLIRGRVLQLKDQEFTLASRSLGAGRLRLLTKHLLPNALGLIIITLMLTIPSAIFTEAVLSFIGLGIQVPNASLGALIDSGADDMRFYAYLLFFPAAVFCLLMLCFNLLADGLRDALDPRMRK
jgi:oligopeptide transport system permease protein